MSVAADRSLPGSIIDLHFENEGGKVRVTLPDKHVMFLAVEAAVRACGAFQRQIEFNDQFSLLLDRIGRWIKESDNRIGEAFVTTRDGGLLFLVVQKQAGYDPGFEDKLTELDSEIANDADFGLIRFGVLSIPPSQPEAVASFLSRETRLRFKIDDYIKPEEIGPQLLFHRLHQVEESALKFLKAPMGLRRVSEPRKLF